MLDALAPPYNDAAKQLITGGALHHLSHMISYAAHQTSPHGPKGIASYPWQWLVDSGWITYLSIVPSHPSAGLTNIQPEVHFLGLINPPILLAGLIGLGLAAFSGLKRRIDRPGPRAAAGVGAWGFGRVRAEKADHRGTAAAPVSVPVLAVAWFLGTFLPFLALTLIWQRTSYLYYMVIVMPGIYVAAAFLLERVRWRWLLALWLVAIAIGAGLLYPFNPFY